MTPTISSAGHGEVVPDCGGVSTDGAFPSTAVREIATIGTARCGRSPRLTIDHGPQDGPRLRSGGVNALSGLTLLVGGARSGKSTLAVELGRRHAAAGGAVVFVATAPRIAGDADLDQRIRRHQAERPGWPTVEEPTALVDALHALPAGDAAPLLIVDCLTLWVSNLLYGGSDDEDVRGRATELAAAMAGRAAPTVVISNEVGLGIHPGNELGRRYRDLLGHVNQHVAAAADTTLLLVAGRALRLDDPIALLGGNRR